MRKIYAVRTTFALGLITLCALGSPGFAQQGTAATDSAATATANPGSVGGPASSDAGKATYMSAGAVTGGSGLNSQATSVTPTASSDPAAQPTVPGGASPAGTPSGVPTGAPTAAPSVQPTAPTASAPTATAATGSPMSATPGAPSAPAATTINTTTQSTAAQPVGSSVVESKTSSSAWSKYDGIAVMVGFFLALILLGVIFMFVGMKPKD